MDKNQKRLIYWRVKTVRTVPVLPVPGTEVPASQQQPSHPEVSIGQQRLSNIRYERFDYKVDYNYKVRMEYDGVYIIDDNG